MGAKKYTHCPRFPIVLTNQDSEEMNVLLRPRCKMWTCPYCSEINRRVWRRHLKTKLSCAPLNSLEWSFSTLTLPEYVHEMETEIDRLFGSIRFIRNQWDRTMKTLKRQYGRFEYVRVLESHKSLALHVHLLASIHFDDLIERDKFHQSPAFQKIFESYEWGFTDTRHMENGVTGTVNYVTKYMTKTSPNFHSAVSGAHLRRIQTSRKIGSPQSEESPTIWIPRYAINSRDLEIASDYGKYWWDLNEKRVITGDDLYPIDAYPLRED